MTGISEGNKFIYPKIYGEGLDLSYDYENTFLKEQLIIDRFDRLPEPGNQLTKDNEEIYLSLEFELDTNDNVNNKFRDKESKVLWDKQSLREFKKIEVLNENNEVLTFLPEPYAIDSKGNKIKLQYQFKKEGQKLIISILTPYSWISDIKRVYPIYIDPSTTLNYNSGGMDSEIDSDTPNSNFGSATNMEVYEVDVSRSLIWFNMSSIMEKAVYSSSMTIYKESGSLATITVYVHRILNEWIENQVTWNNRKTGTAWDTAGGDFSSIAEVSLKEYFGSGWHTWNMTNVTKDIVKGVYTNYGWILTDNPTVYQVRLSTQDNTIGGDIRRPYMTVNYYDSVTIDSALMFPNNPLSSDNITCNTTPVADASTVKIEFRWFNSTHELLYGNVSGVSNNTNSLITTLGSGNYTTGNTINCSLRGYYNSDIGGYSDWKSSLKTISSQPPTWDEIITSVNINHSNNLSIQLNATDPDLDALTWNINESMATINQTGYLFDNPAITDYGNYSLQINVTDGSNTIEMNISYEVINNQPLIDNLDVGPQSDLLPTELHDLVCNYNISDVDSDNLNISFDWYNNGASQSINNGTLGYGNTSIGELWNCSINITDTVLSNYQQSSSVEIKNFYGNFSVDWITPTVNSTHGYYKLILYQYNISCINGYTCGNVNVTLDPITTYKFNSTYENIDFFAYEKEGTGGDIYAAATVNITLNPNLDSNDGSFLPSSSGGGHSLQRFIACVNEKIDRIENITWMYDGSSSSGVGDDMIMFIYNFTNSSWDYFDIIEIDYDITLEYNSSSTDDLINDSGCLLMEIATDEIGSSIKTDYVQLSVEYTEFKGLIDNDPNSEPFYHNGTEINYECGTLNHNESCIASFWVNATGETDLYEFFTIISSNYTNMVDVESSFLYINLTVPIVNNRSGFENMVLADVSGDLKDISRFKFDSLSSNDFFISKLLADRNIFDSSLTGEILYRLSNIFRSKEDYNSLNDELYKSRSLRLFTYDKSNINEILVNEFWYKRYINNLISYDDYLNVLLLTERNIDSSISITDFNNKIYMTKFNVYEVESLQDFIDKEALFNRKLSDIVTINELDNILYSYKRNNIEYISYGEFLNDLSIHFIETEDSSGIEDNIKRKIGLLLDEELSINDIRLLLLGLKRDGLESISISELLTKTSFFNSDILDSFSIFDQLIKNKVILRRLDLVLNINEDSFFKSNIFRFLYEDISIQEYINRIGVFKRNIFSSIDIIDIEKVINQKKRLGYDSIEVLELLDNLGLYDRDSQDSIDLLEELERKGILSSSIFDSVSLSELEKIINNYNRNKQLSVNINEILDDLGLFNPNISEEVNVIDISSILYNLFRYGDDQVILTEDFSFIDILYYKFPLYNDILVNDDIIRNSDFQRLLTDALSSNDNINRYYSTIMIFYDLVQILPSANVNNLFFNSINLNIDLFDITKSMSLFSRNIDSNFGLSESINKAINFNRKLFENLSSLDFITKRRVSFRNINSFININEFINKTRSAVSPVSVITPTSSSPYEQYKMEVFINETMPVEIIVLGKGILVPPEWARIVNNVKWLFQKENIGILIPLLILILIVITGSVFVLIKKKVKSKGKRVKVKRKKNDKVRYIKRRNNVK